MYDLLDPNVVNASLGMFPGDMKAVVRFGGKVGWGHFEHVPDGVGQDPSTIGATPSVVVADGYFPELGLDHGDGTGRGIDESIDVGAYTWVVRGIEPGLAPGEIRVLLTSR